MVDQIFAWRVEGVGFRAIAAQLSEQGLPCPSAADPERNAHRHGRAWSASAVRAIVMNPKYKGQGIYGRYRKVERLYDVNDPGAGNVTRMSPAPVGEVITTDAIVAGIVTEAVWRQAQTDRAPATPGPRPDRSGESRYALRGLLVCGRCGRRMQGHVVARRSGAQRLGYQCTYRSDYPSDEAHPKSLFVAEERILGALDHWLGQLGDPERLDSTVSGILEADRHTRTEPPELRLTLASSKTPLTVGPQPDLLITRGRPYVGTVVQSRTLSRPGRSGRLFADRVKHRATWWDCKLHNCSGPCWMRRTG